MQHAAVTGRGPVQGATRVGIVLKAGESSASGLQQGRARKQDDPRGEGQQQHSPQAWGQRVGNVPAVASGGACTTVSPASESHGCLCVHLYARSELVASVGLDRWRLRKFWLSWPEVCMNPRIQPDPEPAGFWRSLGSCAAATDLSFIRPRVVAWSCGVNSLGRAMDGAGDTFTDTKDSGAQCAAVLPAGARPLRVWELIGATMTITYGFELDGFLHGDLLRRAWVLVQRQHPYAATSVQAGDGGGAYFMHDTQAKLTWGQSSGSVNSFLHSKMLHRAGPLVQPKVPCATAAYRRAVEPPLTACVTRALWCRRHALRI